MASIYHKKNKKKNYAGLPVDVKSACKQYKATFELWKKNGFPTTGDLHPGGGGGTLNVEVIGMLVGNFLKNPKKYPDFDFKPLKHTKIAIF